MSQRERQRHRTMWRRAQQAAQHRDALIEKMIGWMNVAMSARPKFSDAVEEIVAFAQDESKPAVARLNAATWLLDKALGKPNGETR